MINALTIDLEDWYQTQDFNFRPEEWTKFESRIEYSTKIILDKLSCNNIKATFFILGDIAEKHPELIREVVSLGHEIGSHGNKHRMLNSLSRQEFRDDLLISKKILEDITGKSIFSFRAPTWSISSNTLWALEILEEEGFSCDSSMQPFKTPISGMNGIPVTPFYPEIGQKKLKILEFPPTVLKTGWLHIPFAGGLYLRIMPYCLLCNALKKVNKTNPGLVYIHPWEVDTGQPRLRVPVHIKASHYLNINTTQNKLDKLFRDFEFKPLGELIKAGSYPSFSLD